MWGTFHFFNKRRKGKSFEFRKLLPFQGDIVAYMLTQGVTLG